MIRKKIIQFKIKIISLFQTIIYRKENDRTDRYSSFCQCTNLKSYLKMIALTPGDLGVKSHNNIFPCIYFTRVQLFFEVFSQENIFYALIANWFQ